MNHFGTLASLGLFAGCAAAFGQASFYGLGVLPGSTSSVCTGVNGNGYVAVGYVTDDAGTTTAFRWTIGGGLESLGTLPNGTSSRANGISSNGQVIIGTSTQGTGQFAFRWTAASGMESMGVLPNGTSSVANGVSNDGSIIVGASSSISPDAPASTAFVWDEQLGMRGISQSESTAWAVSGDGAVTTGVDQFTEAHAFHWPPTTGTTDIEIYTYCNGGNSGVGWDNPIFMLRSWRPMIVIKADHPSMTGGSGLGNGFVYNPPGTSTPSAPGVYEQPPETPAGLGIQIANWVRYIGDHHPRGPQCFDNGWGFVLWNIGAINGPEPANDLNIMPAVPGNYADRIAGAPTSTTAERLVAVSGVQSAVGLPLVRSYISSAMAQARIEISNLQASDPSLPDPKHWFMDQEPNTATVTGRFGCGPGIDNIMPSTELGVATGWLEMATSPDPNADTSGYADPHYRRASEGGQVLYDGLAWGDIYNPAARVDADGVPIVPDLARPTYNTANQAFLRWYWDKIDRITQRLWLETANEAKAFFPTLQWSNYNLASRMRGNASVPRSMIDKLSGYWDYNFTTQADYQTLACYPAFGFWFDPTTNTIEAWNTYLGLTSTGDPAADIQNIAVEVHKRRIRNALTADPNRPLAIYLPTVDIGNDCSSVGVPNHFLSEINTRDIAMYAYEQGVRTFLFFDNIEAALTPRAQSEILRLGHWLEDMHATPDDLGAVAGLAPASVGKAVNGDGSVIVGVAGDASATGVSHAFRWSPTGGMQDLGTLPGTTSSSASGVSGDGAAIVGASFNWGTTESSAFLWTPNGGMVDLNTYLPAYRVNLTGWQLTEATAISPDGITIVGNGLHNGHTEGWIATLPHCHSADFNRDGSVGTDADLEDFFSCLAGNCCPACDTLDLNNDGDIGTDSDIETFFRVLGGGSC